MIQSELQQGHNDEKAVQEWAAEQGLTEIGVTEDGQYPSWYIRKPGTVGARANGEDSEA